jgi:uncharacterized protein Smg (DUF494 family)
MQKRLMEIVLYILDQAESEGRDGPVALEEVRDWLESAGFEAADIRRALRFLQQPEEEESLDEALEMDSATAVLSAEGIDYLETLRRQGLMLTEEVGEVIRRAGSLQSEPVNLETLRFLSASIIFEREGGDFSPSSVH